MSHSLLSLWKWESILALNDSFVLKFPIVSVALHTNILLLRLTRLYDGYKPILIEDKLAIGNFHLHVSICLLF